MTTKTYLNSGSYGSVYAIKSEGKVWAEKLAKLANDDLIGGNLREINMYKIFSGCGLNYVESIEIEEHENEDEYNEEDVSTAFMLKMKMPLYQQSLADYIDNTGLEQRIVYLHNILVQLCQGLSNFHSLGLAHGDLKPSNIMINDRYDVCLIDFGGSNFEYNATSKSGGTLSYQAPELFEDNFQLYDLAPNERFGPHNDMWSLGLTILEYLTGVNPLEELEDEQMIKAVNAKGTFPVKKCLQKFGVDINRTDIQPLLIIIKGCLIKPPSDRLTLNQLFYNLTGAEFDTKISMFESYEIKYCSKRTKAIKDVRKDLQYMDEEFKSCFELGLSIYDRYIIKSKVPHCPNVLWNCCYIASCFLLDLHDGENAEAFYNTPTVTDATLTFVKEVLETLDYKLYYPTLKKHLQCMIQLTDDDEKILFELVSDPKTANTDIAHKIDTFFKKREYSTPLKISPKSRNRLITPTLVY